jgi:tetratricopeptide (TPR) repeat protein
MSAQTHSIKHIVTALLVGVGFSLPAFAQTATLDELYQKLAVAEAENAAEIERQIDAEWEKSGSPAMDLLLRRGRQALEEGAPDVAAEHFTALIDHAPDFAEGYVGRANSYYMLGLTGPALDDIRTALQRDPRHYEVMRGLAQIMEELDRPDEALELYAMILEINPHSAPAQEAVDRLKRQQEGQAL